MKIVFGVPWFLPDSIGGTEVYVAGLAEELQKLGVECVVAVPGKNDKFARSSYRNIRTVHYPVRQGQKGPQDILASSPATGFQAWLSSEKPDVYHQHDWSLNCGLTHLQAAKELGVTVVMTVHLAKLICITSTMLLGGVSQCDGQIIESRCAECFMTSRGVPSRIAAQLARIPLDASSQLSLVPGLGRALSGRLRAKRTFKGLDLVAANVDGVVAGCQWLKSALLINGLPEKKVHLVRNGIAPDVAAALADPIAKQPSEALRIGFLGRWIEPKGLHVLIEALQRLPKSTPFHLTVLGLENENRLDVAYRKRLEKLITGHPQIQFLTNQPRTAIHDFFPSIDVLAIPSQLLETGPLVALEANAWKVPVVGSDLGGIRELVRHEIDGLLVPYADIDAWTDAFYRLTREPALLQRLQSNIPPIRTMHDTALEMLDLYHGMIERRRSDTPPGSDH